MAGCQAQAGAVPTLEHLCGACPPRILLALPGARPLEAPVGPGRTCLFASVLLMVLTTFWMALLAFFLLAAEDSSGSQVFQKCRAASITRALLLAMPPNLKGRSHLQCRRGPCCRSST